jgi:hypothetical protein
MRPSPLLFLCAGEDGLTEQLHHPMRGMKRFEKPGDSDEFVLSDGELLGLLCRTGFAVERLVEVYAPKGAQRHERYSYTTPEWATKWPAEEIWAARKAS